MSTMPRPDIPQPQKEAVERIHKEKTEFEANSFQEALSTVISLAEEGLARHHTEYRDGFRIEIDEDRSRITLEPSTESKLEFEYFAKGDPPHTAILDTGVAWIGQDSIVETIEGVQEVGKCYLGLTTGEIVVEYTDGGEQSEIIVEKILYALSDLINSHEQLVIESERTRRETREDAIAPYWPHIRQTK